MCGMFGSIGFIYIVYFGAFCFVGSEVLISTKEGFIRGNTGISTEGKRFNSFYGIYYAQPPIRKLRFKPPVRTKPWNGTYDATQLREPCLQVSGNTIEGSEDCLHLNVFTPSTVKEGDNIPVIVFLHGGLFVGLSNVEFGPRFFMNRDIILVIPNYRIGILGWLSTGDTVIPGNMALKDQTLALKWVKRNIHSFGGDPNRVTLHGHSSGAMCAHLHMLSPLSRGLFDRVFLQSGTASVPLAFVDSKVARNNAFEFGYRLGCSSKNSETLLKCLSTIEAEKFPSVQNVSNIWSRFPGNAVFEPTIENESVRDSFLNKLPIFAPYQDSNVTMMIGMTSGEASFLAISVVGNGDKLLEQFNDQYEVILPAVIGYQWTTRSKERRLVSRLLKNYYLNDSYVDISQPNNLTNMLTDGIWSSGITQVVRAFKGLKYVYLFDYYANYSTQNIFGYYPKRIGVAHMDDIELIFNQRGSQTMLTPRDLVFGSEWMTRIVNFAYSRNPNEPFPINKEIFGEWKPVTSNRIEYLYMNYNGTMMGGFKEYCYNFWKRLPIYSRYYGDPSNHESI